MRTMTIRLPDLQASALDRAVVEGGYGSADALILAALEDFLERLAYDPAALERDIARHRAEKARGEAGLDPEASRAWLAERRRA